MRTISYQQLLYWSTIGLDVVRGAASKSLYVTGHAKSGTNWICSILVDYTGFDPYEPWNDLLPRLRPAVFHMMRLLPFDAVRKRTVYVLRDGRDIMVSRWFETLHREPGDRAQVEQALGITMTDDNMREHLADFIRFMSSYQRGCADYKSHVRAWQAHGHASVQYERMLVEPVAELARALTQVTGVPPDMPRLEDAVHRNSFEAKSRRAPGEESKGDFLRKGISGDWRNHFTAEAARVFDGYAGDLLIELGYEPDRGWVDTL